MITIEVPKQAVHGSLLLPGSKSISNRVLVLSHQTGHQTLLHHLSEAEDTRLMVQALQKIKPGGNATIDVHHAGTDLRFLCALLSVTPGLWTLTGSERLRERPIADLLTALRSMGADISGLEKPDQLPLLIRGKNINGARVSVNASRSSQFLSALLLVAPSLPEGISIKVEGNIASKPYADMTIALLEQFGTEVSHNNHHFTAMRKAGNKVPREFTVESDWSAASYWYSFCALMPGSRISLSHLNKKSLQPDSVLPHLFRQLGVHTEWKDKGITLSYTGQKAAHFRHDFSNCPDIAQTLAVTCFALGIEAHLEGLGTLRFKETDRISALATELGKFGAALSGGNDHLHIAGKPGYLPAQAAPVIKTYNDHRMAMSFSPLAVLFPRTAIASPGVVDKSYPGFWSDLQSLGFNVNLRP